MNANRMKYATTPTYGMQKRGFFRKPASAYRVPDAPDFVLATEQAEIPQPFPTVSQPGAMQPVFQAPANAFAQPPYFPQNLSIPSMHTLNPLQRQPYMTSDFAMPSRSYMQPNFPAMRPNAQGFMPPLGNSAPPINPMNNAFSPRNQGYVPPAGAQPSNEPYVQSAPFMGSTQPLMGGVPFAGVSPQLPPQQPQQPPAGYQTPPTSTINPLFAPTQAPRPQQPPMHQGYGYGAPAKTREPINVDKIWAIVLFAVLPALFIASLFLPESLGFVRYVFIACCVGGLGAMWYRQMYTSSTRLIISVVYVALCVVAIAMSMQGSRDAQRASMPVNPPQAQQATAEPNVAPTTEPAATEAPAAAASTPVTPSQAENRLTTFMSLWMGMNTPEMVSYVQPSWASAQDNPSSQLFMVLANRTPETFEIEDISGTDEDNSRTVTMTALINKNNGKDPIMYRFMVIMTKEGGEWYVDPNSLATNDREEAADENVVNANENPSGLSTEPPRTTVSPAPPGNTKLYYNPNGGHYYHADPNCPSVKSEYLPLPGSFLYSELKEYGKLTPCLKCGAPTKALEDVE